MVPISAEPCATFLVEPVPERPVVLMAVTRVSETAAWARPTIGGEALNAPIPARPTLAYHLNQAFAATGARHFLGPFRLFSIVSIVLKTNL